MLESCLIDINEFLTARYKVMNSWRIFGCALLVVSIGAGCSASGYQMPDSAAAYSGDGRASVAHPESEEAYESMADASSSGSQFHDFSDMSVREAPAPQ